MKFPSLFKTNSPKSFGFQPRYYDERKERIEQKLKEAKLKAQTQENFLSKGDLQSSWRQNKRHVEQKKSNLRVVFIAGILALIFYLILR